MSILEKVKPTPWVVKNAERLFILLCISIALNAILLYSLGEVLKRERKEKSTEEVISLEPLVSDTAFNELNHSNLYEFLLLIGVEFPEIVVSQAKLETGNFTSRYCTEFNNLFGMTKPGKRVSVASDFCGGIAVYPNWKYSCWDYLLWQQFHFNTKGVPKDYYSFLIRVGYAEDLEYVEKLKLLK